MRTAIDPVRYIQNRSSGKMGLALAKAAAERGAEIKILLGPIESGSVEAFSSWEVHRYASASEYGEALRRHFPLCEVFFSLAAVLDFEAIYTPTKIPRENLKNTLSIAIQKVPDFAAWAGQNKKPGQTVIAFAAESGTTEQILARAEGKRQKKNADAIVANPVTAGLGPEADTNEMWVLRPGVAPVHLGPLPKTDLAPLLLEALFPRRST